MTIIEIYFFFLHDNYYETNDLKFYRRKILQLLQNT